MGYLHLRFFKNIREFDVTAIRSKDDVRITSPDGVIISLSCALGTFQIDETLDRKGIDYILNRNNKIVICDFSLYFSPQNDSILKNEIMTEEAWYLKVKGKDNNLMILTAPQLEICYRNFNTLKEKCKELKACSFNIDKNENLFWVGEESYIIGPQFSDASLYDILGDSDNIFTCEFSMDRGRHWFKGLYKEEHW